MLSSSSNVRGPIPGLTSILAEALRSLGCVVVYEPWGRHNDYESLYQKIMGRGGDIVHLRSRLIRERFDVAVVHTSLDWRTLSRDLALLLAIRRRCHRIVLQFHGGQSDLLVRPGHVIFKLASYLLAHLFDGAMLLSSQEQRDWQEFYPAGKFFQVNNPFVSTKAAPPGPCPWSLPPGVPVLLFVGRLIREKGIFELLEAVNYIKQQMPVHLLLVGDGPAVQKAKDLIKELNLTNEVTLTGYLRWERLSRAYQLADLFVLPSYFEGFPTVISEAMNTGLPIITTRLRGMADHLEEGVNAVFVPPRAPVSLANAVIRLLADSEKCTAMSRANQEKVKDFAPERVGGQYLEVLRQIVTRGEF
jgi:glycosyltransferase involved in cell wall biosynthesis